MSMHRTNNPLPEQVFCTFMFLFCLHSKRKTNQEIFKSKGKYLKNQNKNQMISKMEVISNESKFASK